MKGEGALSRWGTFGPALLLMLALGLLPWTLFVLIFTLNGHIVSHLSVGHLPWIAYFLTPWMLVSMVRVTRGDRSLRNAALCAATFAAMILLYTLFAKFVPIISIWEMKAGEHPSTELFPKASAEHALGEIHA